MEQNKKLKDKAQRLRKDATKEENLLWYNFLRIYKPQFIVHLGRAACPQAAERVLGLNGLRSFLFRLMCRKIGHQGQFFPRRAEGSPPYRNAFDSAINAN